MKRHWKKKWLTALRSGEYRQGQNRLLTRKKGAVNRYCCLGVLADIADPQGWEKNGFHRHRITRLNSTLRKRIGLSLNDQQHLVHMNDTGKRFTTIAKWIEENL